MPPVFSQWPEKLLFWCLGDLWSGVLSEKRGFVDSVNLVFLSEGGEWTNSLLLLENSLICFCLGVFVFPERVWEGSP